MQELLFIRGYCSRGRATVHAPALLFTRARAQLQRARACAPAACFRAPSSIPQRARANSDAPALLPDASCGISFPKPRFLSLFLILSFIYLVGRDLFPLDDIFY